MRLIRARVATGPSSSTHADITVRRGRISFSAPVAAREAHLDLKGYLILPGLINAHDHLEFNLFPRLGTRLYSNACEWATDIFRPDASPVREHLTIPKPVRLIWGGLRNLIAGVTTVAHHNPYDALTFDNGLSDYRFPVRVVRHFGWAHSLDFSPDLAERYRNTPRSYPFIVHAAEGTDEQARLEISRLAELRALGPRTVLVHALGAGNAEIDLLRRRGCSIIWCPSSNLAMFGRTLSNHALGSGIPVALGTDSALTCAGDLIDELHTARVCGIDDDTLYRMATTTPASILRLRDGRGCIREGGVADLIAVPDQGQTPAEGLSDLHPALVMINGRIKLHSRDLELGMNLNPISVDGRGDFFVDADVAHLHAQTQKALGGNYALAGRRVAA
jgi:cytosine/adenosine deaminase-related metal-dependent hydrolase